MKKQEFKRLEDDKFSLLEDVKTVNIGNQIPLTLSIGLGLSAGNYSQSYNYAVLPLIWLLPEAAIRLLSKTAMVLPIMAASVR